MIMIRVTVICFVVTLSLSAIFFFPLFFFLSKVGGISLQTAYLMAACICGVITIATVVFRVISITLNLFTRLENFIAMNGANLFMLYLIAVICVGSLRAEVTMTLAELKEMVSFEWTIFNISITIFLVWSVIAQQFLKEKKPRRPDNYTVKTALAYLQEKSSFHAEASNLFFSFYLLIANLFVLLIVSALVFLYVGDIALWLQTFVYIAFFLCTNTVSCLLVDVMKPFIKERRQLNESKLSIKDNEHLRSFSAILEQTENAIQKIDNDPNLSGNEKYALKEKLLNDLYSFSFELDETLSDSAAKITE